MTAIIVNIIKTILVPEYPKDWEHRAALVLQEGCMPTCIVMRNIRGEYVTHRACIQEMDGVLQWTYVHGHYFGGDRDRAVKDFEDRAPKNL